MKNEFEQISNKKGFMKHNGGILFNLVDYYPNHRTLFVIQFSEN